MPGKRRYPTSGFLPSLTRSVTRSVELRQPSRLRQEVMLVDSPLTRLAARINDLNGQTELLEIVLGTVADKFAALLGIGP